MSSLAFDTHRAVKSLQEAGAEESLAEAVVATIGAAMGENIATKDDIKDMATKADIKDLKSGVSDEIGGLRNDISDLRVEFKSDIMDMATKGDITDMATKGDIGVIKGDINVLRGEIGGLKGDINVLRGEIGGIRKEFGVFKSEVKDEIKDMATKTDITDLRTELKSDMEILRKDMTIRLGGIMVVSVGTVAALVSLI